MKQSVLWRDLYTSAMLELDRASLQKRIEAAQLAIRDALAGQGSLRDAGGVDEVQEMSDALHNLQALQRVEFRAHNAQSGLLSEGISQ